MSKDKITLSVNLNTAQGSLDVSFAQDLPDIMYKAYESLHTQDPEFLNTNKLEQMRAQQAIVYKIRADAAKLLSENLVTLILLSMKSKDTHNGYRIIESKT